MAYQTEGLAKSGAVERDETALENVSSRLQGLIDRFRDCGIKMDQALCRINGSSPAPPKGVATDKVQPSAPTLVSDLREKCRILDEMANELSGLADRLVQIG